METVFMVKTNDITLMIIIIIKMTFLKKIIEGYLKILFFILKKMGKMRKILDNAISGFLNKHTDTLYIV